MMVSFDLLAKAAQANTTVLITGETGTGKELFAQAIHENSSRCGKKIVTVDCAGLKDTLVESILFGYEKGSFTGAEKSRDGLIIEANRGTLFLDEVGELPLAIQKNFLRVLQERCFRPVGGKSELQSDFRLIAATNRNLEEMVRQGEFRGDLLYRLRGFTIELPPLRERPDDVRDLSLFYIGKFCERLGMEIKGLSPEFFEALISYPGPETFVSSSTRWNRPSRLQVPNQPSSASTCPTQYGSGWPRRKSRRPTPHYPGRAIWNCRRFRNSGAKWTCDISRI